MNEYSAMNEEVKTLVKPSEEQLGQIIAETGALAFDCLNMAKGLQVSIFGVEPKEEPKEFEHYMEGDLKRIRSIVRATAEVLSETTRRL